MNERTQTPAPDLAPALDLVKVAYAFGAVTAVRDASVHIPVGTFAAIVGPNGAGKSTLLKLAAGILAPSRGSVRIRGASLQSLPDTERAAQVGFLPQSVTSHFPYTCREMVSMGRAGRTPSFFASSADHDAVDAALRSLRVSHLADRPFPRTSGGEQRLVLLAKMLAQDPEVLLLDEPLASLDLSRTLEVATLLSARARSGRTVVAVMHDLDTAMSRCDLVVVVHNGTVVAAAHPAQVCDSRVLDTVYNVRFRWIRDPETGALLHVAEPI